MRSGFCGVEGGGVSGIFRAHGHFRMEDFAVCLPVSQCSHVRKKAQKFVHWVEFALEL